MTLTYGSVCSGIGAPEMAWKPLGWTSKFVAEIEKFPSAVLAHHFGCNMPGEPLAKNGVPNHGDFTKIPASAGPVDLLVGGTPCQAFSVAGKRLGLDDPRGNLALEFLGLARRLCARWIVWENVPGVLSSFSGGPDGEIDPDRGWEGDQGHDFATFCAFVQQCGYGFAYRVFDTQYVRTQRFPRAIPQRRRRVILVGYLGDWRRAAAVLFEPEGLRGDPAPDRETGQGAAGTLGARAESGGGLGGDFDLGGGLQPEVSGTLDAGYGERGQPEGERGHLIAATGYGGGRTSGPVDVAAALAAHGVRQDFDVETFVLDGLAPPLTTNPHGDQKSREGHLVPQVTAVAPTIQRDYGKGYGDGEISGDGLVAHTLCGEGFDASDDGTGRGTPVVPIAFDCKAGGRGGCGVSDSVAPTLGAMNSGDGARPNAGGQVAIAIQKRTACENPEAGPGGADFRMDGAAYTLEARTVSQSVAFDMRGRDGGGMLEGPHDTAAIRAADGGSSRSYIAEQWAVRRLTPAECARLQGFPDDHCRIPWNGKPAEQCPDGPQYKGYGNSMSANVMGWLGERIDLMERLIKEGRIHV